MVNIGLVATGGVILGGVVVLLSYLYEEYQRSQRGTPHGHKRQTGPPLGGRSRAPPQPSTDCMICRDTLSSPLEILPCGHLFHKQCIRRWFAQTMVCPVCRNPIADDLAQEYSQRLGL